MPLQTATNPQTGERVALVGDQWQPIEQTATNAAGQKAYLVGGKWVVEGAAATPTAVAPAPAPVPTAAPKLFVPPEEQDPGDIIRRALADQEAIKRELSRLKPSDVENRKTLETELLREQQRIDYYRQKIARPTAAAPARAPAEDFEVTDPMGTGLPSSIQAVAGPQKKVTRGLDVEAVPAQFASGVKGMQQSYFANAAKNVGTALNVMDRIDRGETVRDADDPTGYQYMTPAQRAKTRAQFEATFPTNVAKAIAYGAQQQEYAKNPNAEAMIKAANEKQWGKAWQAFSDDPVGVIQQLSVQSAPNALPSLVGGAAGVLLRGGVPAMMAGLATGSFPVEYMSSIVDSLQDAKVNMKDANAVAAKLRDPEFLEAAGKKAVTRGVVIATADALGGKLAMPLRPNQLGKNIARGGANVVTEVGTEMGGEFGAQVASAETIKIGDIIAEGLGAGPQAVATTALKTIESMGAAPTAEAPPPAAPPAPPAPPRAPAERIEPTFDEQAAAAAPPAAPEARVEPTLEAAAPPAPEARLEDTDAYKTLFNAYRKEGLTREDADALARKTLQEREVAEAKATAAAATGDYGMTPAGGLPPVQRWPDGAVTATLEFQLAKPEDQRNDALVAALEQEVVARGLRPSVGEERVAEPVSPPSGEGAGVAGVTAPGAPAEGARGAERAGVVPAATDVGQPTVGEGKQPVAVEKTAEELEAEADAAEAPQKARIAQAIDVAKANVSAAFDQRREYGSLQESIDNYRDNVRDTLVDLGISDQFTEEAAFREFDRAVQEGLAKETAAEAPVTEVPPTTTAEAPVVEAPKGKRGRPKVELTPEEQEAKEQQRKEGRAAYTKADRQVKKAVETLDELAQPLDESQFPTEEALKEAQAERASRKRQAIRTLLEVEPNMRGTALAKRIKEALGRPDVSEREKADIKAGIEALKKSGQAPLRSTDPAARTVNPNLSTVQNGAQALAAILKTGNAFQKLIANRLRAVVAKVQVVVVEKDGPVPDELREGVNAEAWDGARGLYILRPDGSQIVYLRGESFGADQGVNNVTALHELLHAATSQKLYLGLRALMNRISVNSQIAKFTREVSTIMARSSYVYGILEESGKLPKELAQLVESTLRFDENGNPYYSIFTDPHEFLAYGMSDPTFQEFLNAVPDTQRQPVSLFSRFVESVRSVLGIPANATTSLTNLVNATDQLIAGRKTPWMRRVEATERKAATGFSQVAAQNKSNGQKVNRVERKIQRSRESQDVVEGLGDLTELRKQNNLLDLISAGWDAFNIKKLEALLPALQTDAIVQWADRLGIKGLDRAWRGLQDMASMRANMLTSAADVTREWLQLQPGIAKRALGAKSEMNALADVMHYSTDAGIDPSAKTTDPVLNRMWDALSPKAKEIYKRVRDSYKTHFDLYRLLLDRRIEELNIPGDTKDADTPKGRLMSEIKKLYEASKDISPYFPLMRYGDYWVRIGKGKNVEFYMFESPVARELFLKRRLREAERIGAAAPEVEKGNSLRELRNRSASADTSDLLKDIFGAIDEAGALDDKELLKDQIYQLYLTTMPEQSFRRQFVHRKGTTGFSGDALRNYITSTMNMANQLARLKYGPQVLNDVEAARKSLEGNPDKDKLEMLVDEMGMRADLELFPPSENPAARTAANVANRTAFLYYMTSIKTALSQFASLPIFGVPVLLSRHNPVQVMKEMSRFMLVFNEMGVAKEENGILRYITPTITESRAVKLNPDEQLAIEAMQDRGLADVTLTYDLMDRREVPTTKYIGAWKTATNMMGALFHNVERLNREVMYLTSFRLTMNELAAKGVKGPAAVELAIEQAVNDTYTALGNFTEGNRARSVLGLQARGPLGKTVLQFKTFPAFVTTYFVRNAYRMMAGMNKEEKKEAAVQLFGTLGMSYLLAGYVGIPGISFAMGVLQGLLNIGKDDEEEDPLEQKDLETWVRNVWIPQVFGEAKIGDKPLSEIADAGTLNSISGYDMNSSLSMNNMWFPELKESATYAQTTQDYAVSLMGPFAGLMLKQVPGAMDDFRAGRFSRGLEKLMPNLIRQPMAAYRYSKEGVTTPSGDVIRDPEEFTRGQLVMQALGYRTEGLADVQTANFKANAIRQKVMQEKIRLVSRLDLEATQGSDEAMDEALEEVLKFNSRYPMAAVKSSQLSDMLQNRMKARQQADRGFRVDKRFYPYLEELLEPSRAKIEREAAKK